MGFAGDYICDLRTLWSPPAKAFLIKVVIEKNNGSFCLLLPKVPLVTVAVPVFPSPPPCSARSSPQEPLLGLVGLWRLQEAFYQETGSCPHRLKSQSFWRQQQRRYEVFSWIIHDETNLRPQFENGPKASFLFSDQEYEGRLTKLRSYQILVYSKLRQEKKLNSGKAWRILTWLLVSSHRCITLHISPTLSTAHSADHTAW